MSNNKQNNILLHPSLEIKDGILVLGFHDINYSEEKEKTEKKNLYLISIDSMKRDKPYVEIIDFMNHFKYGEFTYIFDVKSEDKNRNLVNINSRWSKELISNNSFEFVEPGDVYNTLYNELKAYLELERDEDYHIITSWIIGTYFFILFKAYPYLHIKGMKGSGKTTALDFMRLTCFNAFKERSTMPSFRDNVDSQRGTALIDQADKRFGTQSEDDMIDVMVDSYKSSSGIISKMVTQGNKFHRTEYNAYVPKAFASIKELNFDLRDRCIQIQFIKSLTNKNQLDSDNPFWLSVRHSLYCLLIHNYMNIKKYIDEVEKKFETDIEIVGRNAELWKPIESIMNFCGVPEDQILSVMKAYKSKIVFVQDGLSNLETAVIEYIDGVLTGKESDWIAVKDITTNLTFTEDEEWEERSFRSQGQLVGNLISRMNLHSSKKHKNGGNYYLFEKAKLEKIKTAYLSDTEVDLSPVFTPPKVEVSNELF